MLILELAIQGVRELPELYRLSLKKGLNVLHLTDEQRRADLVELFFNTLFPNSSRAEATSHLAAPGSKKSRVGLTYYARDKNTYRLVRDVRLGSTALYRFDQSTKSFELLTETAPDTAQFLRVQERLPDEGDYEQLCLVSPQAMGTRGGRPKWRERGEVGARISEPSAPGLPARGVSAMGFLQGGALMFETEETALDRKPSGFVGFGGQRAASMSAPAPAPALMGQSALEAAEGEVSSTNTSAFVFEQHESKAEAEFEVSVQELAARYEATLEELRLTRELEGAREEIDRLSKEKLRLQDIAKEARELETKRADTKRRIAVQNPELLEFPDDAVQHVIAFRTARKLRDQELGRFRKEREETEAQREEHLVGPLVRDPLFLGGVGFALLSWVLAIALSLPFVVVLNLAGGLAAAGAVLRWINDKEREARLAAKLAAMRDRELRIEQKFEADTQKAREILKERVNVDLENLIDDLEELRRLRGELSEVEEALARRAQDERSVNAVEEFKRVEQRMNYLEARLLGSDESVSPAQKASELELQLGKLRRELAARGAEVPAPPSPAPAPAAPKRETTLRPGESPPIPLPGSAPRPPAPRVVSGTPIAGTPVAPGRPVSGVAVVRGTTIPGTPVVPGRVGSSVGRSLEDDSKGYGEGYGRGGSSSGGGLESRGGTAEGWYAIGGGGISGFSSGGGLGGGYGDGGGAPIPETDRTSGMVLGALGILQLSVDELMERHGPRLDQYLMALARDLKTVRFDVRGTATFGTGAASAVRFGERSELRLAELAGPRGIKAELALQLALIEVAAGATRVPIIIDDPALDQDPATRATMVKMLQYVGAVTQVLVLSPNADFAGAQALEPLTG